MNGDLSLYKGSHGASVMMSGTAAASEIAGETVTYGYAVTVMMISTVN